MYNIDKENIKKKNEKEEISHYYFRLTFIGYAMFAYYDGEPLTENQIKLIVESSSEEKIRGMNLVAGNRLKLNKDGSHRTFCNNSTAIKLAKNRSRYY